MDPLNYSSVVSAGPGWTRVTTPSGQTVTVRGTRSTRNNNPGNIEYGSFARSHGAIGSDGRFAVFPSREAGFGAVQGLVFNGKYSNLSLKDAIARYAPPSENQSLAYAKAVAAKIGVSLDTKMSDIPSELRAAVAHAMSGVEGLGRAVVSDLEGNILGTINPRTSRTTATAQTLPDQMQAPPQRYQPVAASTVAPTAQTMQAAMRLANVGNASYSAPLGKVERSALPSPGSSAYATTNLPSPRPSPLSVPSSAYATTNLPSPRSAPSVPPSSAYATTNLPSPRPSAPAIAPSAAYATTNLPSVAPAVPSVPSALTSPSLMGPAQTFSPQTPVQPTFTAMAQPVAPPVAPVAPPVSVPQQAARNAFPSAPQRPSMPSAMDVYNGQANLGRANDGSMVSRDQFGNVSITNKYGATTTTLPSGQMAVSYGKAPSPASSFPSAPSIDGPLGTGGITTKQGGLFGIQPAQTETGNLARGFTGAMAGSALGSFAGPIGSIIGAAIGKSIAQGKNPFDALTGNRVTYATPAFGNITAVAPRSGGQFPTAPTMRGALGGSQSNNSMAGMRSISPGAASAISRGQGGLY